MNGRPSLPPIPRSATVTSSRPASASKTLLNDDYIQRIAIDPSAGLGSFCDARTECVVGELQLGKTPIIKTKQYEKVDCTIIKNDIFDCENLFRKIGIHDESWLNSILNIIPSHGIASVVNYSFPKTTNTRFLYYYYISEEQSISHEQNIVRACIPNDIPDISTTHVISAMKVGIQALLVLQLSPNDETGLDCLLEDIAQQLITNKFEPRREEKSLSERIIVTKIFSNIPDLNKMSTFTGICQKIIAMKPHIYRHHPIEFTLRTIQWFYPLYSTKATKYIPVEPEIVKKIKKHLLSLSSQIGELKTSLNPEHKQTVEERHSKQYDALRQQITDAEKMYSVVIERIRNLVIKIRSGAMKQEPIDEILSNITEQSFQSNTNLIESRPQALRDREQQINKSDKQNIEHVDKHQLSNQQPIDTKEQSKPVKSSAPSTAQVTLEPNKKSKEIEGPSHLSLSSKKSSAENAPSRTDSLNGVERTSNLSTIPTSQPSLLKEEESTDIGRKSDPLRSEKTSTTHRKAPLNQETTHETEQCNESKPSMMSGPAVSLRSQRQGSNSNEPIRPTTPLKSSNLVTLPSKLSPKIEEPVSQTTSPDRSVTEGTTLQGKQHIKVEDQQTLPKSPALAMSNHYLASSQQTEGDRDSSDTSILPTKLDKKDTSPRRDQLVSPEVATNQSIPSTSQFPPVPKRRASTKNERQPDTTEPSKSSITENTTISNQQTNNDKELSNTSNSPRILTPQLTPQIERKDINEKEPFKPSPTRRSSASDAQANYPGEHHSVSDSSSKLAFDATQPPKERPKNSNKQRRPSSSPTSSNKQSENIGQSFNPSIPPNLLDRREMSSQDKQHAHSNKQHTSRPSSTQSSSEISLTMYQENEENNTSFHSSISSKQSDVSNTSPRTMQVVSGEDPNNRSRSPIPSNPAPSARTRRQIRKTDEQLNMTLPSNRQTNNEKELSNTSHSPMISTPQTERKDINEKEPFKPSPTRRSSASDAQANYPGEHHSVSDSSSKLAFDATQPPKERLENSNKPPRPSSAPIPSNKQPENIRQSCNPSITPNLLDRREMSSQDKQHAHSNKQHTSRPSSAQSISEIPLTMTQENEENNTFFNSSISSKQSDVSNTSPRTLQVVSGKNPSNRSRPPISFNQEPSVRTKRQRLNTDEQLNMTIPSNRETNNEKELSDTSHVPIILTPRATSQAKQDSTNNQEFLHTEASVQSSTLNRTSSSAEPSKGPSDQVSSSASIPILSVETSQRTEKQLTNTEEQVNQLVSSQSFVTEHASSSEQQPNDVKPESDTQKSPRPSTPNSDSSTVKYTNVLLLGESGVGKSTFINALLNYHAFNTFEEARSNQPFVAMPVSFLMTVGDQFEEKIVRFGGVDPNEDHDHPGQSVTQHCRSYVFQIGTQTKLRIIDTPGMGDTRGLEQDDRNMQHIVSFINNLSHLNAICILLKPNESRLTIVLRSYFTRLLNFLGENARNNIVFCFTNTRATFYAPGNTGPLLRKMIDGLPIKGIPFAKTNTFCFDSEAFRYLVALQNGIKFDTYQEKEYQESWTSSSTVSNRFLKYICAELKSYSQKKWQSIEHAQFQINQLIRPMLETMRNLFRNINLLKEKPSRYLIKLRPIVLSEPASICYTCPRISKRFLDYWILPDDLHTFSDKCNDCDHSKKKHIDVDYKLEYKLIEYEGAASFDKMNSNLYQLRMAILEFSQFYGYVVDTLKQNDPILSNLKRIIAEENQICSEKDSTCLNSTLRDIFLALKEEYQDRRKTIISVHVPVDLPSVYELIRDISEMDEMSGQMRAIKKAQKRYLKQHEKQVS